MLKKSFFTFGIILLAAFISNAQVPQLINYQAMLTDASGSPINGVRSIQFSIYDSETGGNALWSETQNVIVTDGLCNVLLGAVTLIPHSVFDGGDRYFSLKVGDDPEMTPRKRLVSVGYAFHSNDADSLDGYGASDFVRSVDGVTPDDGDIRLVEGTNITIEPNEENNTITISAAGSPGGDLTLPYTGTTESSSTAFSITNTGTGRAGYFKINKSDNNNQVIYGETNGMGRVGHFRIVNTENDKEAVGASTQGTGPALYGYTIGSGPAVYGRTDGDGEAGHFEINNSNSSSNVISGSTNGTGYGIYGKHSSSGNHGYLGGSSNGVFGTSVKGSGVCVTSVEGNGVNGFSVSGVAVSGETVHESGQGVYGKNNTSGNFGWLGGSAEGVFGSSVEGDGVLGYSGGGGTAVRGNSPHGIAVSAEGDLKVTGAYKGDISSSSGSDGAPFPRPAYDSGWVSINQNEAKELTHNIGGNVEDYVVDMTFKNQNSIHIIGFGCYRESNYETRGANWQQLTNQKIRIFRAEEDESISQIRIRIWVYK